MRIGIAADHGGFEFKVQRAAACEAPNMANLTGDGRLCAYAMITKEGKVAPKECTPVPSEMRIAREDGEIERIRAAASVAVTWMAAAIRALKPVLTESRVAAEAE